MDQLNFRAPDDLYDAVDTHADEHDVKRSEAARTLLAQGIEHERGTSELDRLQNEHECELAELERELEQRDARIRELENELRAANRRIDDANDVAESTREMVRVRKEDQSMESRRRQANIFKRTWWKLAGEPDLETADG